MKPTTLKMTLATTAIMAASFVGTSANADQVKDTTSKNAIELKAKDVIIGIDSETKAIIPAGDARVDFLEKEGFNYEAVQNKVNEILNVSTTSTPAPVEATPAPAVQEEQAAVEETPTQTTQEATPTQAPVETAPPQVVSDGSIQGMAHAAAAARGWGDQLSQLDFIIDHESGWNPMAQNPSSTAFGLFQMLTETSSDPATQIQNGLDYIASRYGNPAGAYAFWMTHNWY